MWKGLCPHCRNGRIFAGALTMNERCPSCGIAFSREPGYFSGAMYFSYTLAMGVLLVLFLAAALLLHGWPMTRLLVVATVLFVPFIPAVFRYSRILWIYFDRHFEPDVR
jgi:uncharacterized protein (DUF983 family)